MYINFNQLLSLMRKRKSITSEDFLEISGYDLNLNRVEIGNQMPKADTITDFLDVLQIPEEDFFRPYSNGQPLNSYTLRTKLLRALEWGDEHKQVHRVAINLIEQLESMKSFSRGFNKQFLLNAKAQLFLQLGKRPEEILPLIFEGIAISFPEFSLGTFNGEDILAFDEPFLLTSLAKVFALQGDLRKAIELLKNVQAGIEKLPFVHTKDVAMVPILLALAELQISSNEYDNAIETCNLGNKLTQLAQNGKYAPNFLFMKAQCLHGLEDIDSCRPLFKQAYFGFVLLQKEELAKLVLTTAKKLGITFETYGVENLISTPARLTGVKKGEFDKYENIGELISSLRKYERLSLSELCDGICSTAELSRIENGKTTNTSPWILQALMQRLGRNPELYLSTFLSAEDFEDWNTDQNMIYLSLYENFDEIQKFLKKIESKESYKTGLRRQRLLSYKCPIIINGENGVQYAKDSESRKKALETLYSVIDEGIRITIPDFDERLIASYRLTVVEAAFIVNLANYYFYSGELSRTLEIFARLRTNIDKYYTDKNGKMVGVYFSVAYGYPLILFLTEQLEEALEVLEEGFAFTIQNATLAFALRFASLKGNILNKQGHKQDSIPYFALTYFNCITFAEYSPAYANNMNILGDLIKQDLDITFDI